jgi:hypothetical protein
MAVDQWLLVYELFRLRGAARLVLHVRMGGGEGAVKCMGC